jgi:CRISPR-associated protein Cmr6
MPIWMPSDTRALLGDDAQKCESRSLFMDRFSNPEAKETDRRKWFEKLASKAPVQTLRRAVASGQIPLYGQLQSRLMVNMAGGVMENAGLCLDRFGMPYIPGSAVKGCARRCAVAALHEWCETHKKPGLAEADKDNAFKDGCKPFAEPADMLVAIACVFGWGDTEWRDGRKRERNRQSGELHSDFEYACGEGQPWKAARALASERLLELLKVRKRTRPGDPWMDLPSFAGLVSFLPALAVDASGAELPLRAPRLGALDLDVVTCHQSRYYRGERHVATDDDDPNPVIFPAAAAGHVFTFSVLPVRNCTDALLKQAHQWLNDGLSTFGLGAKTAAGYGWFDCSDEFQRAVTGAIARRERQETERLKKEAEASALKAMEEAERKRREEDKAALASLSPDQQEDYKLGKVSADQLRSALDNFATKTPEEMKAIVRALRLPPEAPFSRRAFWEDLKTKALKRGGKLSQTEQAIRQLSKQMYPGKEGKMP